MRGRSRPPVFLGAKRSHPRCGARPVRCWAACSLRTRGLRRLIKAPALALGRARSLRARGRSLAEAGPTRACVWCRAMTFSRRNGSGPASAGARSSWGREWRPALKRTAICRSRYVVSQPRKCRSPQTKGDLPHQKRRPVNERRFAAVFEGCPEYTAIRLFVSPGHGLAPIGLLREARENCSKSPFVFLSPLTKRCKRRSEAPVARISGILAGRCGLRCPSIF